MGSAPRMEKSPLREGALAQHGYHLLSTVPVLTFWNLKMKTVKSETKQPV